MNLITEKLEKEKEQAQKKQLEAISTAVAVAIGPLQREITSLKGEVTQLKKIAETSKQVVIDDSTKSEIRGMMAGVDKGFKSYNFVIYLLIGTMVFFCLFSIWNMYSVKKMNEELEWKYDVITGILSGERQYWWNGENYEASRKAPEAKRLQEAVEIYHKASEQMKKQANK